MLKRKLLMIILFTFILGCAYKQGTLVTDNQLANFKKGVTTKQEVLNDLGGPQDIKVDGKTTIFIYKYQQINSFKPNYGRDVTFIFKNDILKEVMVSKGSSSPNPLTGR